MLLPVLAINAASNSPLPLTEPVYIFCILLLSIAAAPLIAKPLHLPPLVVLIVLGGILGSNVTGILARDSQLILLEKIGLLYIMLLAGLQMDLSKFRLVGARSLIFGLLTFSVPLTAGIISGHWLTTNSLGSALLGILYSPHTLVSYPIVTVLGIVKKEAVAVAIGGTIVTSILTLSGLSIVQAIAGGSVGILLWIKLLIFLPLLVLISLWGIPKFGRRFIFNSSIPSLSNQFIFILSCLFLLASAALLLGVDCIVGGFIAGLSLNPLVKNEKPLMERIEFVGNSIFIPTFLISVGVLSNPRILFIHPENLKIALVVIAAAVGGKFLAAGIAGIIFRYTFAETMVILGLTMSRAALVLVVALYGKQAELLNEGLFNAIILYILITCLLGPLVTNAFGKKIATQS